MFQDIIIDRLMLSNERHCNLQEVSSSQFCFWLFLRKRMFKHFVSQLTRPCLRQLQRLQNNLKSSFLEFANLLIAISSLKNCKFLLQKKSYNDFLKTKFSILQRKYKNVQTSKKKPLGKLLSDRKALWKNSLEKYPLLHFDSYLLRILSNQILSVDFNPGVTCSKPLGGSKVDSAFHTSEVGKMSTRNCWEHSGQK